MQLGHYDTLDKMPDVKIDCVLLVCGISSENLGLIMRSADVFGANAIYYLGNADSKKLSKLSRNSHIPVHFVSDSASIKGQGYQMVALEITDNSIPLRSKAFQDKVCLVIGNEQKGIPDDMLNEVEDTCHIEMIGGRISSLNVSMATSIALYEISQFFLKNQPRQ